MRECSFAVFKMSSHYLPPNTRIYCIGDIHGRVDLLSDILNQIDYHNQHYTGHSIIVYLGDYIDRGAYSKQVIDLILNHQLNNTETVYLRGNHEQIFLNFIEDKQFTGIAKAWFSLGGKETLESYGKLWCDRRFRYG